MTNMQLQASWNRSDQPVSNRSDFRGDKTNFTQKNLLIVAHWDSVAKMSYYEMLKQKIPQ